MLRSHELSQKFNGLVEQFKTEHVEKVIASEHDFPARVPKSELAEAVRSLKFEQLPVINLATLNVYERYQGVDELLSPDEAAQRRQAFRERVYAQDGTGGASPEFQRLLSEHDKIAMLADLKFSESLKSWRAPNPDLAAFQKDWRES